MFRSSLALFAFAGLSVAATNTYIVGGTGSGYWGSQPFTDASFEFTFTADTTTFLHGTPCCASVYTTPSGTPASVTVNGFPAATLTGDEAIFVNNATSTGGIWHYNDPEYLTVTNSRFATNDLSVPMEGYVITGTDYSYATPMPLSTGDSLYFTSVHDVHFYAHPGMPSGQPSAVSVTPNSSTMSVNATQTFQFVVSDTAGASDLSGLDILFQDSPNSPAACWLYYQVSSGTLAAYHSGNWSSPVPIGASGSTISGDACAVDTTAVTVSTSGSNLTFTAPIRITSADNTNWPIYLQAINSQNTTSGYVQVGTVTVETAGTQSFVLTAKPAEPQGTPLGSSAEYTIDVQPVGGFNDTITFSGSSTPGHTGNSSQLSFSFNPPTLQGSGTTHLTVSSSTSDSPDIYDITITGTSQSVTSTTGAGPLEASNVPPTDSISPNTGAGSSQTFAIQMTDRIDIRGVNLLISPSLSGQNACWIYFDGSSVYLAGDDGTTWTRAGAPGSGSASNSQCSIDLSSATYDIGSATHSDNRILRLPVTFNPGFAGTKTLFVRANNYAGFDTGYQPLGGWTVQ